MISILEFYSTNEFTRSFLCCRIQQELRYKIRALCNEVQPHYPTNTIEHNVGELTHRISALELSGFGAVYQRYYAILENVYARVIIARQTSDQKRLGTRNTLSSQL
jgi:hypothetical protein